MKKLISPLRLLFILLAGSTLFVILTSYSDGPAASNLTVSGAPFNGGQTCASCHLGGSFGGSIVTSLRDSITGVKVTSYIPGRVYEFEIKMTKTMGTPYYGYQTTAALQDETPINNFRGWKRNSQSVLRVGRQYVEHRKRLPNGRIRMFWTAPQAGSGPVIFYTAGNLVNFNYNSSGDEPVNTHLTIQESTSPISNHPNHKVRPTVEEAYY